MLPGPWVVVVPVKDASQGKTRLAGVLEPEARVALVRAMALDTIDAVLAATQVGRVVVVTADPEVASACARRPRVRVEPEPETPPGEGGSGWAGLDRAVLRGSVVARQEVPGAPVAVLLGDLPALDPAALDDVLHAASAHARAIVPDAQGTGTTLLTVGPGIALEPRFGTGSAAAHGALGHVVMDLPSTSTLRQDVDLPADLAEVRRMPLGARTGALLRRLGEDGPVGGASQPG